MEAAAAATSAPAGPTRLELRGITVAFGGLVALDDVGLAVRPHQVHGVIGPNGAGKTTLFNVACGFQRPDRGTIRLQGAEVGRIRPHHLPRHGMARTLQGLGLFDRLSVVENVMVGADHRAGTGFLGSLLATPGSSRDERVLHDHALAVLDDLDIAHVAQLRPTSLPYPVRKRVALARALAAEPDLLLLDEPASGLSSSEVDELGDLLRSLTDRSAVMLVEHHMDLVMRICDEITVLDFGKAIAHGTPDQVRDDPAVLTAYLGEDV